MPTKTNLKIDWATHEAAKYAVENWHYSSRLPSTMQKLFKIGIWEESAFIGVIIFGHGANPQIGSPYGLSIYQCCELTRVAMKPGHRTPVSKALSIALKFLRKAHPNMRLIVSYADQMQKHHGGIYQASNWIYVGSSRGVPSYHFAGREWHAKALRTSYPNLSMSDPRVKKMPAGDKHKYLMPLDDEMRRQIEPLRKPYPKRAGSIVADAPEVHSGEGGSVPTPALHLKEVENGAT